jgi:hypothetical protein
MVAMLFPLTSPIPTLPEWSIDGIISHVKSFGLKPRVCVSFYAHLQFHIVFISMHYYQNCYSPIVIFSSGSVCRSDKKLVLTQDYHKVQCPDKVCHANFTFNLLHHH